MSPSKTLTRVRRKSRRQHDDALDSSQASPQQASPEQSQTQQPAMGNQATIQMLRDPQSALSTSNDPKGTRTTLQNLQSGIGNQAMQRLMQSNAPSTPVQREGEGQPKSFQEKLSFFQGGGQTGTSTMTPKEEPKSAPGALNFWKSLEQSNAKPTLGGENKGTEQGEMPSQEGVTTGEVAPQSEAPKGETLPPPEPKSGENISEKSNKSTYETKGLLSKYQENEKASLEKGKGYAYWEGNTGGTKVKYIETEEDRKKYELDFDKDNGFFRWQGKLFDTTKMESFDSFTGEGGRAIFVMGSSGKLYAADQGAEIDWKKGYGIEIARGNKAYASQMMAMRFNHSSFFAGEPIAAAGEMIFANGMLKKITDASGHYQPGLKETLQVLDSLKKMGAKLDNVVVERFGSKPIYAIDLLEAGQHPDEKMFRLVEELVRNVAPAYLLELLEKAYAISPEALQKLPGVAEHIELAAFKVTDAISDATDSLKDFNKETLALQALRATRVLKLLELTKKVFGDKVDDKLITQVQDLKKKLENPPTTGDEAKDLDDFQVSVVDSYHGIRKIAGVKKSDTEDSVSNRQEAIHKELKQQLEKTRGLQNYGAYLEKAEEILDPVKKPKHINRSKLQELSDFKDSAGHLFRGAVRMARQGKSFEFSHMVEVLVEDHDMYATDAEGNDLFYAYKTLELAQALDDAAVDSGRLEKAKEAAKGLSWD